MGFEIPSNLSFLCHLQSPCTEAECKDEHFNVTRFNISYSQNDIIDRFHINITEKLSIFAVQKLRDLNGEIDCLEFEFKLHRSDIMSIYYVLDMNYNWWKSQLDEITSLYKTALRSTPLIAPLQDIVFGYLSSYLTDEDEFNFLQLSRLPITWLSDLCIRRHLREVPICEEELATLKKDLKIAE